MLLFDLILLHMLFDKIKFKSILELWTLFIVLIYGHLVMRLKVS